jgi:hypothetical protein
MGKERAMAWTLVYAHDANGNATGGSLLELIRVVESGHPIRFLTLETYGVAGANAEWVYVTEKIVYAENTSNISDSFQGNRLVYQEDSFHWFVAISTRGDRDMIRWKVGEHTPGGPGHTSDRVGVQWFAEL